jgi:integrative and conjugative element protein (TIGR02256 family)
MMSDDYIPLNGQLIDAGDLLVPKARELAMALQSGALNWVRPVECRRLDVSDENVLSELRGAEVVVFDVEAEVPQRRVNDIRPVERVAVVFWPEDNIYPETLALRGNFPRVPHTNLRTFETPRSLCLYDEPYSEIKLRWTAPALVERIRGWLAKTATGTLHAEDQLLEPLLFSSPMRIILPSDFFSAGDLSAPEKLSITRVNSGRDGFCLIAVRPDAEEQVADDNASREFVATTIVGAPQTHGIIRRQPASLFELHQFLESAGVDLLSTLRERVRTWQTDKSVMNATLVVILVLPKTRVEGTAAEDSDVWAFMCMSIIPEGGSEDLARTGRQDVRFAKVTEVGEQIGLWENHKGAMGALLSVDTEKRGERVEVALLNPTAALSRESAARFNGLGRRDGRRIAAVGAGALGSQVFLNHMRAAYGEWEIIDKDLMLPHNQARHGLYGLVTGHSKAEPLAFYANHTIDGPPIAKGIVADVLNPGEMGEQLRGSFTRAEIIFDFSASVAVARHLAHKVDSPARRASLFINPQGTDLVMLVEDAGRKTPLDALEMHYYRLLTEEAALEEHLRREEGGRIRYAYSCRDVSSTISQEHVALHAAIGSRALRLALDSEDATIAVWQAGEDGSVRVLRASPSPAIVERKGDWTIRADERLLEKARGIRSDKLPNETGGVLIGTFDTQHKIVYVVDVLPAPPDSREQPTGFIRGFHGLTESVERIEKITAGQLTYVGEWHSHPRGHGAVPSDDYDRKLFEWLRAKMAADGLPPLMLIVGDRARHGWYLETMPGKGRGAR